MRRRWSRLPLANRFALYGSAVTVAAMLLCGVLITSAMTEITLQRRGTVVPALVAGMLAPHIQHLGPGERMAESDRLALDAMMADDARLAEFPYLDLWGADGSILYSNSPQLEARRLDMPLKVQRAFEGEIGVDFTDVRSQDYAAHGFTTDFIEIYFPLRNRESGEIVAVAQVREVTASLEKDLWWLTLSSWTTAATIGLTVMVALFGIVLEGSRKIERQGRILSRRLAQSHQRAARHRELKAVAQRASLNVTEFTDKHLRTIGTDLHDGPAQTIGFAVLRLDQLRRLPTKSAREKIVAEIETTLGGALAEIRAIALALVLPDIGDLDLAQVIERAVEQHTRRTGISIDVDTSIEPVHVAPELSVCVYRFIQEGLNNAFHHGLPEGQTLTATMQGGVLKLSITNRNLTDYVAQADHRGIGLYGLRARVQSIGGHLAFVQKDGRTRLEMWVRHV
ncbi:MAG TPA: histidine kinase [Devosia sp.]|nr:histidine kinase [Devosia sp.]